MALSRPCGQAQSVPTRPAPIFRIADEPESEPHDLSNKGTVLLPCSALYQFYNFAVTRPSKGGEAFLIVFGLVFASGGIFFASSLLFGVPGQVHGDRGVGALVSTIFIVIGGGIVYAAIYGTRKLEEQAAVEQSNPESPWLWRKDWAGRRAESKGRNSAIGLWIAATLVNAITLTVAAVVVPKLWQTSDPKIFLPLVFCIAGIILAVVALRASIRRKRFGQTYFELASLPFCPGESLKGTIHLRFNTDAQTRH